MKAGFHKQTAMYKKEKFNKVLLLSLGWTSRTLAQDARGRGWAFEVAERSEVGALESLASNLVRRAALGVLVILV